MALPLLFMAATGLVRAATPAIARYLVNKGISKATAAQARGKITATVTKINQAKNLKPTKPNLSGTPKVVGKKPNASIAPTATKPNTTGNASKPLRAKPEDRIGKPVTKKTDKKSPLGTTGQRTLIAIGSLAPMIPRGDGTKANASKSTANGGMSAQSEARRKIARAEAKATGPKMTAAQKAAREKRLQADSKRAKAAEAAKSKSSGSKLSKFEQAFADARKAGKKTFKFKLKSGKTDTFTTERIDKKPLPKKRG